MARIAGIVVPGTPHHITQRGNPRERTFFEDDDYRFYLKLLAEASAKAEAEVCENTGTGATIPAARRLRISRPRKFGDRDVLAGCLDAGLSLINAAPLLQYINLKT